MKTLEDPYAGQTLEDTEHYRMLLHRADEELRDKNEQSRKRRAALTSLSVEQLQALLAEMVKEELVNFLSTPEQNIRAVINGEFRKIILTLIGIDTTWSELKIKSDSAIGNTLGRMALAEVQLALPEFMKDLTISTDLRAQLTKSITLDFESRLRSHVSREIDAWLQQEAKRSSADIIAGISLRKKP